MKKITLMTCIIAFFGVFQLINAQNIAHLNSMELLSLMPEKKQADQQLQSLADQKKAEIKKQEDSFATKYKKLEDQYKGKTPAELEKLQGELQKIQEELQKDQQNLLALRDESEKELMKKQESLYEPITKKAQEAVNEVAKSKGYLYVFDTSQPSLIYAAGPDILNDVKAKLGIK